MQTTTRGRANYSKRAPSSARAPARMEAESPFEFPANCETGVKVSVDAAASNGQSEPLSRSSRARISAKSSDFSARHRRFELLTYGSGGDQRSTQSAAMRSKDDSRRITSPGEFIEGSEVRRCDLSPAGAYIAHVGSLGRMSIPRALAALAECVAAHREVAASLVGYAGAA
jgi:hypothetical protein